MSDRRLALAIGAAAVITVAVLQVPVAGQAPASATKTTTVRAIAVPRTEWGQPDLRGIWNFGSATPLQRPDALAGKDFLKDEEAAAVEEQTARTRSDDSRASSCGGVGNYNSFWYDQGGKVVGSKRTSLVVDPADGRIPSLTPRVQTRQAARCTNMRATRGITAWLPFCAALAPRRPPKLRRRKERSDRWSGQSSQHRITNRRGSPV